MNVPSFTFLAFAAVAALLVNASRDPRWRAGVLVCANIAFIGTFAQAALPLVPFALFVAGGFVVAKLMARTTSRSAFGVAVVAFVLAFVWLKRYTFVPAGFLLPFPYVGVGLSYVFFRVLSLIIDSYQRALAGPLGPVAYINYTLNFTSFVSGPIQLYGDYARNEAGPLPPLDRAVAVRAIERIVLGFFKVGVCSPLLSYLQTRSIEAAAQADDAMRIVYAALSVVLFPIYLYVNFSGYMDVVIGAARFLRLDLPENFDHPFSATGFIDFWSRWHMTLSNWLKTYVFSPLLLSLMRRYPSRAIEPYLGVGAFFVTFFLVGVWHGQTTEFLCYGVLQGLGVSVNKLYQIVMLRRLGRAAYRSLCARPWYAALSRALTFAYFSLTLLWFWSTWTQLGHAFARLAGAAIPALLLVFMLGLAWTTAWRWCATFVDKRSLSMSLSSPYVRLAWSTALTAITLSVTVVLNAPAPHVVYKAF